MTHLRQPERLPTRPQFLNGSQLRDRRSGSGGSVFLKRDKESPEKGGWYLATPPELQHACVARLWMDSGHTAATRQGITWWVTDIEH